MDNGAHRPIPVTRGYLAALSRSSRYVRAGAAAVALAVFGACAHSRASAQPAGGSILEEIERRGVASKSAALLIFKNGEEVLRYHRPGAPERMSIMSITKPIVALAVLTLIEEGHLASIDEPVYTFYPEWKQGRKQLITVRHLLNHTSGLQKDSDSNEDIWGLPNFVQAAIAAELEEEPGSQWRYNNKAYNLLGGIIERASGERAEDYIRRRILDPLGIVGATWTYDHAGQNIEAMGGLHLRPGDLVHIGQLIIGGGRFAGRQVMSEELIRLALQPGPEIGYGADRQGLGWRLGYRVRTTIGKRFLDTLDALGADPEFKSRAAMLAGTYGDAPAVGERIVEVFANPDEFYSFLDAHPGVDTTFETELGAVPDYIYHSGALGQYLYILPDRGIVAVRMVDDPTEAEFLALEPHDADARAAFLAERWSALEAAHRFPTFGTLVTRLR